MRVADRGRAASGFWRGFRGLAAVLLLGGVAGGCALQPTPLTQEATEARIQDDLESIFREQEPVDGPVTLHEAMARAVMYNLDHRLTVMEEALKQRQLDLSRYDLLPRVMTEAGYRSRSNFNASSSQDVFTGQESLTPSTSEERDILSADLNVAWNVLDFGVSYFTARQQADRALIAYEQRRRVVHGIIQDVRSAYWRAVAAQRLAKQVGPLLERVEKARKDSARIQELRLESPIKALTYRRTLLNAKRKLQDLRRDLSLAKIELATLMNLPPDQDFEVAMPGGAALEVPKLPLEPQVMEDLALAYRPELRREQYQARVSADETRKALVRLLPGLEFHTGYHLNSNDFLVNNDWADYGVRVSWNLLNLLSAPARIEHAESQEKVAVSRRQALSMAVLSQVYVSYRNYQQAVDIFRTNAEVADVETRIVGHLRKESEARSSGELAVIQGELNALIAKLRRDLAFARARNALGRVYVTVGADPLPDRVEEASVEAVSQAIGTTLDGWRKGELHMRSVKLDIGGEQGEPEAGATSELF